MYISATTCRVSRLCNSQDIFKPKLETLDLDVVASYVDILFIPQLPWEIGRRIHKHPIPSQLGLLPWMVAQKRRVIGIEELSAN